VSPEVGAVSPEVGAVSPEVGDVSPDAASAPAETAGGSRDGRWVRDPAVLWRRSSDRIVVLPPGRTEPLLLEGTGAAAFELLDVPASVEELAATFAEVTGSDRAVIAGDLWPFLEELAAEGVLAPVAGEG
jgi:hypothetical protein